MLGSESADLETNPPPPTRRAWSVLAALTVLLAALHLVGIDWQLPHYPQSDEKVIWLQVQIARGVEVTPQELVFARSYPALLGRVADVVVPMRGTESPTDLASLRADTEHDLVWIRVLIAILSAGILPATWFAARRLVGERWASVAAALASLSTIALWFSSMGRPHAVVAVFTIATTAAALRARATGRIRDFVLAGVFAALAVGTLQSGACACAAVAAAWLWNARPRLGRPLVGSVAAAGLVFASLAVFLRGEPLPAVAGRATEANRFLAWFGLGVHNVDEGYFDGGGFARFATTMRDYEPILALLGGIGFVVLVAALVRRRIGRGQRAAIWVAAAHPILHLAVFGYYGQSYQRFWFPLIPTLAILAAFGIRVVFERAPARAAPILRAAVGILLVLQLAIAFKITVLRARDDTHEIAADWIEAHPDEAPFYVWPTVHVPLVTTSAEYRTELLPLYKFFVPWPAAQSRLSPQVRARIGLDIRDLPMRTHGDRKQIADDLSSWLDRFEPGTFVVERVRSQRRMMLRAIHTGLEARSRLFDITIDPNPLHFPATQPIDYLQDGVFSDEDFFAWNILWVERIGPEIEIRTTRP